MPFLGGLTHAQVLLISEGFETDGEGTRYVSNAFNDCGGIDADYFLRTNTNPVTPPGCPTVFGTTLTGLQGSFFWASEDIRTSTGCPSCRPPGFITAMNNLNILNYNTLQIKMHLATSNNNGGASPSSVNTETVKNRVNLHIC